MVTSGSCAALVPPAGVKVSGVRLQASFHSILLHDRAGLLACMGLPSDLQAALPTSTAIAVQVMQRLQNVLLASALAAWQHQVQVRAWKLESRAAADGFHRTRVLAEHLQQWHANAEEQRQDSHLLRKAMSYFTHAGLASAWSAWHQVCCSGACPQDVH